MATVIERLVIQGCNPLGGGPGSSARFSVPASRPYRKPTTTPAATPVVGPTPASALSVGLLTISGQGPPGSTHGSIKSSVASAAVGKPGGTPTREVGVGCTNKKDAESEENRPGSAMQGDALTPGGTTPIVKKMEYLALVRQARQGMSSADGADHPSRTSTMNANATTPRKGLTTASSRVSVASASSSRGSIFVVEGRKVTNRSPALSCRTSRQGHRGNNANKKTRFVPQDEFNHLVSDSEVSFAGSDQLEGYLEQYHILPTTPSTSTLSSTSSFRGGSHTTGSVRSHRSDLGLSSSTNSLMGSSSKRGAAAATRLPVLTRGSSEPGGVNLQSSSSRPLWRRHAGSSASISSRDELTSIADDLLLARLRRSAVSKGGSVKRSHKEVTGNGRSSSPRKNRAAQRQQEEEQLRACLSVAGKGNNEGSYPPQHSQNGHWSAAVNSGIRAGPSPRAQDKTNLSSEGALLFKRHKLMEKLTKKEEAKKYHFTSVNSYLNYNKLQNHNQDILFSATIPNNSMPPPSFLHYPSNATTTGTGKPTPRAPGPTPEASPRKNGPPLKRGMPHKYDTTIITDLDEYFTVKTPRFDSKAKAAIDVHNDSGSKNTKKPRDAIAAVEGSEIENGGGKEAAVLTGEVSSLGNEAQAVSGNGGETPQSVTVSTDTAVTDTSDKKKRGPIVSVPSADSEQWTDSMVS